jgi:hypothetical protein
VTGASSAATGKKPSGAAAASAYSQNNEALTFNNQRWQYDAAHDVYWQTGVVYCASPETTEYESMGIYVPGAYLRGTANGDGTCTCTVDSGQTLQGYTARTAPIVMPVNTPGYFAHAAPADYSYESIASYLEAGFIYVDAGMRGRENGYDAAGKILYSGGAPWGVTDLKAAVRYYRFNQNVLPGSMDRIFTFGMSGGGAQSALMGATGDSELYVDYLQSIGAAMTDESGQPLSDAVCGAMCWCPITSLDTADAAYEWNMGQYFSTGSRAADTFASALSQDLAGAYAAYINALGLKDKNGQVLTLEQSSDGVYTSGSYASYLLAVVEESLNNFLKDTAFPYARTTGPFQSDGQPGGAPGTNPAGLLPDGAAPAGTADTSVPTGKASSVTYVSAKAWIDSLNADGTWIQYDAATNTVRITSLKDFVTHCKQATKSVGAFDDLKRSQAENDLFGNDQNEALHFDAILADILTQNASRYSKFSDWDATLAASCANDLTAVDKIGNPVATRLAMYNPMYYLSNYYEGYGTSKVAPFWRIRTGIEQGDTASTVEVNLALALQQNPSVRSVDFATVWGQGHTLAERTGDSTGNFIAWVNQSVRQA